MEKNPRILEYLKYQNLNPKTQVIRIEKERIPDSLRQTHQKPSFQSERRPSNGSQSAEAKETQTRESLSQEEEVGQIEPLTK